MPPTPSPRRAAPSTPTTWPPSPPTSLTRSAGSETGPSISPHPSPPSPPGSISNPVSCSPPDTTSGRPAFAPTWSEAVSGAGQIGGGCGGQFGQPQDLGGVATG